MAELSFVSVVGPRPDFDWNPLHWLGSAASAVVGDVWTAAMIGLWSAAMWLLKVTFGFIDAFTTPDLSAGGPLAVVLPTTLWIGATLAGIMLAAQLAVALLRRDAGSLSRVLIGMGQFGLVWAVYLGVAAGLVAAAQALTGGILRALLNVSSLSQVDLTQDLPTTVADAALATVLGVLSLLVVIPAAFFLMLIMLVREAALLILVATSPISAGGLVSDVGRTWFWKTVRWFFSCLLIEPISALILGIAVSLAQGVFHPPAPGGDGAPTGAAAVASHAGMAVVACLLIAVAAVCPLVIFRLLAFVEPSTASGAALRSSFTEQGGLGGLLSGSAGKESAGSAAAAAVGGDGRSGGETAADKAAGGRLAGALAMAGRAASTYGAGVMTAARFAGAAVDLGADVLGQAGVGHPSYSLTPADEQASRRGTAAPEAEPSDEDAASAGSPPTEPPLAPAAAAQSTPPSAGSAASDRSTGGSASAEAPVAAGDAS